MTKQSERKYTEEELDRMMDYYKIGPEHLIPIYDSLDDMTRKIIGYGTLEKDDNL